MEMLLVEVEGSVVSLREGAYAGIALRALRWKPREQIVLFVGAVRGGEKWGGGGESR